MNLNKIFTSHMVFPASVPVRIYGEGTVGIFISGDSNILANSVIDHSAGCGVYLGGLYSQIDNNIMKNCGYMSI